MWIVRSGSGRPPGGGPSHPDPEQELEDGADHDKPVAWLDSPDGVHRFALLAPPVRVGSAERCDIAIGHRSVEAVHFELSWSRGEVAPVLFRPLGGARLLYLAQWHSEELRVAWGAWVSFGAGFWMAVVPSLEADPGPCPGSAA